MKKIVLVLTLGLSIFSSAFGAERLVCEIFLGSPERFYKESRDLDQYGHAAMDVSFAPNFKFWAAANRYNTGKSGIATTVTDLRHGISSRSSNVELAPVTRGFLRALKTPFKGEKNLLNYKCSLE